MSGITIHVANVDTRLLRGQRDWLERIDPTLVCDEWQGLMQLLGEMLGHAEDVEAHTARLRRLEALADTYPGEWASDRGGSPLEELADSRYAAIASRDWQDKTDKPLKWWISTHDTLPGALASLAEAVIDGDAPLGVIDLDTGSAHGVHIATPVVSDTGGEGAPGVPWDAPDLPAINPGQGVTSRETQAG